MSRLDPAFYCRSHQHDTVLRDLTSAVRERTGLSTLTGQEGTGKTALLERLRDTLESAQIRCGFLRDSRISTNRFFEMIALELDLRCPGTSPFEVFSALQQFTLEQTREGHTVALIVDNAHHLPADVLNEILHLASLRDDNQRLLQIVLTGRPELSSILDVLQLERLQQKAILSCHLKPSTLPKAMDKLARLPYTVNPTAGIFGPVNAPARAVALPSSRGPIHPTLLTGATSVAPRAGSTLIPLVCSMALTPQEPARNFLNLLQSLRPCGPVSKLKVLHSRPSLLQLPNWRPAQPDRVVANTIAESPRLKLETALAEIRKAVNFSQQQFLTTAIAILSVIALYGLALHMSPAAEVIHQGWQQAYQAILDRGAVAFDEDFRAGLDDWTDRQNSRPTWRSDAAGFVHPAALALYRPSLGLTDYHLQFVGTIDHTALSWVVRAADFDNYYAVRIAVLKPGPVPEIGVTRYAVINGKTQNQVTTPMWMSARPDTVYHVSLDVKGDHYALSVQDQLVDSWSEPRLQRGGIGLFSDQDAGSRVEAVQVKEHYDMLGRLCAFLAPPAVASYQASVRH